MTAPRNILSIRPQVPTPAVDDWRNGAVCAQIGPGLWDDGHAESPRQRELRERSAKAICVTCPVRPECLAFSISIHAWGGIWGGLTEAERDSRAPRRAHSSWGLACRDRAGSHTGLRRHKAAHEHPCPACQEFSHRYDRERRARQRTEDES